MTSTKSNREFIIDFIAKSDDPNIWRIVLVKEGPWAETNVELRRLQERLYNCIDTAVDGQPVEKYPVATGKQVLIQVDGYNLPGEDVSDFFNTFSSNVMKLEDYAKALKDSSFVEKISFSLNLLTN